jgi:energy-coupling factor transporter ATP-binding protein EcfA2
VDVHTREQVFIKKATRRQGLLIVGASGSGKSNLLENLIVTDIVQGNFGVCLFDPHGDLLRNVIARIPPKRIQNRDVSMLDCTGIEQVHDFRSFIYTMLDLREVMEGGKVLLVKIDPYHEEVATLLCSLLLRTAYGRTNARKRRQFHVYADDFDLYATEDFAELIKKTRKYGIACTLATQTIAQMSGAMRAALGQLSNIIAFQLSIEDANLLAGKYLAPPLGKYQELVLNTVQKFLGGFTDKLYYYSDT